MQLFKSYSSSLLCTFVRHIKWGEWEKALKRFARCTANSPRRTAFRLQPGLPVVNTYTILPNSHEMQCSSLPTLKGRLDGGEGGQGGGGGAGLANTVDSWMDSGESFTSL